MSVRSSLMAGALFVAAGVMAGSVSPVGVGLFDPVQFPAENTSIHGVRINIGYMYSPRVYGVDLGVVNNAEKAIGFEAGAANFVKQLKGVQAGAFNRTGWYDQSEAVASSGVQLGWGNVAEYAFRGVQAGVANLANTVSGVQIGLCNTVQTADANGWTLQIGFLNFNDDGYWPVMPLVGYSCAKTAPAEMPVPPENESMVEVAE